MIGALLAAAAVAGPTPWIKEGIGASGWPSGLISNTRFEERIPLYRSDSVVFRDTHAGLGGRLMVTPAFVGVGPRISFAPIDVFDVDLHATWLGYYGTGSGLMPFEAPVHALESDRSARAADAFPGTALTVSASPTLKLRLGPIVAFDAWTLEWWHVTRPDGEDAPLVYEPLRDMVMAWDDTLVQQQAAALWMVSTGDDGPLLWLGPTARDVRTVRGGDRSTAVGGVVMWRPGVPPKVPTLLLQVLPYVTDADRVGGVPNVQGQVEWTFDASRK